MQYSIIIVSIFLAMVIQSAHSGPGGCSCGDALKSFIGKKEKEEYHWEEYTNKFGTPGHKLFNSKNQEVHPYYPELGHQNVVELPEAEWKIAFAQARQKWEIEHKYKD